MASMTSETIRLEDTPFTEVGRIVHEGLSFDALGAVESDGRLFGYVREDGTVGNWDGSVTFGRIVRRSSKQRYNPQGYAYRMDYLRIRRPDGSCWYGCYGPDWRQCITLRPMRRVA